MFPIGGTGVMGGGSCPIGGTGVMGGRQNGHGLHHEHGGLISPIGGTGVTGGGSWPMGGTGVMGGVTGGVGASGGPGGRFMPGHVQACVGSQNGSSSGNNIPQHGQAGFRLPIGGTGCAGGVISPMGGTGVVGGKAINTGMVIILKYVMVLHAHCMRAFTLWLPPAPPAVGLRRIAVFYHAFIMDLY